MEYWTKVKNDFNFCISNLATLPGKHWFSGCRKSKEWKITIIFFLNVNSISHFFMKFLHESTFYDQMVYHLCMIFFLFHFLLQVLKSNSRNQRDVSTKNDAIATIHGRKINLFSHEFILLERKQQLKRMQQTFTNSTKNIISEMKIQTNFYNCHWMQRKINCKVYGINNSKQFKEYGRKIQRDHTISI